MWFGDGKLGFDCGLSQHPCWEGGITDHQCCYVIVQSYSSTQKDDEADDIICTAGHSHVEEVWKREKDNLCAHFPYI